MTPEVSKTVEQRVTELTVAIAIAEDHQDYVFARELRKALDAILDEHSDMRVTLLFCNFNL